MIQAWLFRQTAYVVIAAAVIGGGALAGWWVKEQGRKEMQPVIDRLQSELEAERAARQRNEEALNAYTQELELLRNRPRSNSPVRLCVTPSVPDRPTPASVDDPTPTARGDSGQARDDFAAGPDIGIPLRNLAYRCDVEQAKLRALQEWVNGLVAVP
jgi:hypothetical protein